MATRLRHRVDRLPPAGEGLWDNEPIPRCWLKRGLGDLGAPELVRELLELGDGEPLHVARRVDLVQQRCRARPSERAVRIRLHERRRGSPHRGSGPRDSRAIMQGVQLAEKRHDQSQPHLLAGVPARTSNNRGRSWLR